MRAETLAGVLFGKGRGAILGLQIRLAFVYGLMARQEERTDSDVDIMVIGEVSCPAFDGFSA